ncbi:unnamed protein product [Scytosiphon promiscuus]
MPWVYRSSSSGFQERVSDTTREKIQVGEELRYPATLTAAEGGAEISLGVDGRLLHAPEARAAWIHEKILAATTMIAANTLKGPFTRCRVDRAQLSLSLGDIDEDKARTIKTLFTPSAEASAALLRGFTKDMEELERAGEGGGIGPDSASAGAAMKEDTSRRDPSPTVLDGETKHVTRRGRVLLLWVTSRPLLPFMPLLQLPLLYYCREMGYCVKMFSRYGLRHLSVVALQSSKVVQMKLRYWKSNLIPPPPFDVVTSPKRSSLLTKD